MAAPQPVTGITVSVVTPCYNGSSFLRDALMSAVRQSHPPLEIIVVDDGSTDDSAAIAESMGDPVRVIRQPNQGESVARNRGIAHASGTHFLFLDADDLLEPDALASLAAALVGKPDAVALMGCAWFRTGAEPYARVPSRHCQFYPDIIDGNFGPPICWLVPAHLVRAVGGFCEAMRWFEDWDLWWRVGLHASELVPVSYVGGHYRQHAMSLLATTSPIDRARGHATLAARMGHALLAHPHLLDTCGDRLYWSVWSALTHARAKGVAWDELGDLSAALLGVSRRGPSTVTSLLSARVFRSVGVRAGFALQGRWAEAPTVLAGETEIARSARQNGAVQSAKIAVRDVKSDMATDSPLGVSVSIITPCYNGAPFLNDTLTSAIRQSLPPVEVIVIDDGSTDESANIAESFGDPVRVIRQANQGESVARNRGIAEARGTHLLFLDADDLLEPDALAHLAAAIAEKPNAVALMGCAWFHTGSEPYARVAVEDPDFYPDIIEKNLGPPNCWLVPTSLVRRVGGFCEPMHWFEDWDLWWRVGLQAEELVPVPYIGGLYRQHQKSQLSTTRPIDRARGHAVLTARLASALLERPDLLDRCGERLYWSIWSALAHARSKGVPWNELASLGGALRKLSSRGPAVVTSLRSARVFRTIGVRAGFALQRGSKDVVIGAASPGTQGGSAPSALNS